MRNYVVILNWNGWKDTIRCLEGVFRIPSPDFRVILCDNGSTDGSLEKVKAWAEGSLSAEPLDPHPADLPWPALARPVAYTELSRTESENRSPAESARLVLIQTGANLGFAGGNNVGIRYALRDPECEYLWLLNNDTVPYPKALEALIGKAKTDSKIGAVASITYYFAQPSQVETWAGAHVNLWVGSATNSKIPRADSWFDALYGASLLLTRAAFECSGLLDPGFFLYWEETELCVRLRQQGFSLAAAPSSRVLHRVNGSLVDKTSSAKARFFTASGLRIIRIHHPVPFVSISLFLTIRILRRLIRFDWRGLANVIHGAMDYYQHSSVTQELK